MDTIGKYRIVEQIGRGGMGTIYKAHDPDLDRLVALKVISPEVEVTAELRARFFREAKACAQLNHPNVVTVHEMGEDRGQLFIVMELLEGQELRERVKGGPALTLDDKLSVMIQVCRGLHYAHQRGIVHRDMKPSNVFLLRGGGVKILDFGVAQLAAARDELTRTGELVGTPRYLAPEQIRGRADHRSDMFALGSVLYELLTSQPAFPGESAIHIIDLIRSEDPRPPRELDPAIPAELEAIVQRAMRKDPAARFHDLDEMASALDAVRTSVVEPRPPTPAPDHQVDPAPAASAPAVSGAARTRPRALIGVIAALAVIVVAVVIVWRLQSPAPSDQLVMNGPPATSPPAATPPAAPPEPTLTPPQAVAPREEAAKPESPPPPPKSVGEPKPGRVGATTPRPPTEPPRAEVTRIPPPLPPAAPVIRKSIEDRLLAAGLLRKPDSDDPGVTVEDVGADGRVRLIGVLRDAASRQATVDLVRAVPGVTAVDARRVTVQKGWVLQ